MAEVNYLTKEGLENLKKELMHLRTKGRAEIALQIREAREKGDISENAEYDAAKEAQGHLEARIARLENLLATARLIDESKVDTSRVQILSRVRILNLKTKKEQQLQLVSETESDIKAGRISVNSPIGKGLLGKKVGDKPRIQTPGGTLELEIMEISGN